MMEMVRNAVFNMVMSLYGCSAALPEEARCVWGAAQCGAGELRGGGGLGVRSQRCFFAATPCWSPAPPSLSPHQARPALAPLIHSIT